MTPCQHDRPNAVGKLSRPTCWSHDVIAARFGYTRDTQVHVNFADQ